MKGKRSKGNGNSSGGSQMSLMVLTRAVANFAVCTKFALSAAWVWCRQGRRHSVDGGNRAPPMRLPNTYEFTLNRPIKVQQQKRRQRIRLKNASLKIEWHIQCPNSRPAGSTRGSVHNVQRRRQKGLRRTICHQSLLCEGLTSTERRVYRKGCCDHAQLTGKSAAVGGRCGDADVDVCVDGKTKDASTASEARGKATCLQVRWSWFGLTTPSTTRVIESGLCFFSVLTERGCWKWFVTERDVRKPLYVFGWC